MWTRRLLKDNAKIVLSRTYWTSFAVAIIFGVISSSFSTILNLLNNTGLIFGVSIASGVEVVYLLSVGFSIFIVAPITVGLHRYFMEARAGRAPIKSLFSIFDAAFLNVVLIQFLVLLFTFLWSLLLFIPGIIKSYEYRMVPYILSENPNISRERAFELSKRMTEGEKMNMFVLDLSFIGWILLGVITCGLGLLFINPYIFATNAELYTALRTKAMANNYTDTNELPGFIAY